MIRRKQQDTAKGHSKKEWRDTGEKNQTDIQRKGVAGMDEEMVLCAASAYERKFYLNPEFNSLPEEVKQELQIMCVLYTADVGGILMVVYDENGNLELKVDHKEDDFTFDEIGSVLKIKELQKTKEELFESLEMFYKVFYLGEDSDDI
ncbi:hypothetical protein RUMLAC_00056 [[Ruminococcus] lactaris ATCC 29176]|jgi:hypothetical protein|uniref:Uncharacterized protein n=3 Tax=[Ruminococcus] lactaris TaxID=46228 RepID=B5CKU2_9FIRM|nr:DUF6145 family protein [[Ruminococcus] lactaris]EDY34158.1 hypothetical protein RUMLAC_00056 [[Ruminococcus] lactaris ATCC 29176]